MKMVPPRAWACLFLLIVGVARAADAPKAVTLKQGADGMFDVGVGVSDQIPDRPADHPLLLSQFGIVTPENCMKPAQVRPAEDRWEFAQADRFVEFATAHGLKVVGHCLVWAKDDRTPAWFYKDGENVASKEVLLE